MNAANVITLSPLVATGAASIVVMMAVVLGGGHRLVATLAAAGLAAAFALACIAAPFAPRNVTPLVVVDRYALFYTGLVAAAAFFVTLLSYDYLRRCDVHRREYYVLLLLATTGAIVLVSSRHLASFFLGLEVLSVSLYGLIAYRRESEAGVEAAVKYLILGGVSSAMLLFGAALVYADIGSMQLAEIAARLTGRGYGVTLVAGLGMALAAVAFKMALVPFHTWAPDVYQGSPAPATAFIATAWKGAIAALLVRYFATAVNASVALWAVFAIGAIATMFVGNLLALLATNVKRILAYSSIAHMGYILVAFLAGGQLAATAVTYYLVAYFVTMLGTFGVITALSRGDRDADAMEDYRGLAWRRPGLAAVFTIMLLSLAGVPVTAGFVGKFWVLLVGARSSLWVLVFAMVVNSAMGLFYYLRIIIETYRMQPEKEAHAAAGAAPEERPLTAVAATALAVLSGALILLGVWPSPVIDMIKAAVTDLY